MKKKLAKRLYKIIKDIYENESSELKEIVALHSKKIEGLELEVIKPKFWSETNQKSIESLVYINSNSQIELVKIPAGEFIISSNNYNDEKPVHKVTLKEFYMGKYPVTQAQYQAIMGNNPSTFKGENNPVEMVSWNDAQEFCQKLSQKTGKKYKLPSEAQWEYACRAGSTGKWCFGDDEKQLKDYAWYSYVSDNQTHPVGQKKPNKWGLYDMHGNVWEWCEDDYANSYQDTQTDNTSCIDENMKDKSLRGGSCGSYLHHCRCAFRNQSRVDFIGDNIGFRVIAES